MTMQIGGYLKSGFNFEFSKKDEIIKFLKWLPKSSFTQITKDALMLVLYTGVRSGEAVAAEKKHFNLNIAA